MASVQEVPSIAEELWCSICLSTFQDPCMLGCGHSFCLSCLDSCVNPESLHAGTCPECEEPFTLQEAAHNRVLDNLPEKSRQGSSRSGGTGSWCFCEEHEEPFTLFCSQDEAPVCVMCRDLPQHQNHRFLPLKNAVKGYQKKLKASLESLEDGVNGATQNESRQLETIGELEILHENLCGSIFIAFEELREILNEREQAMMETVKQMKEDNQAEMENRLDYLKEYKSSHTETICTIQAALKETNDFAFLKGIKELMEQVQDHLREEHGEAVSEDVQRLKKSEEKKDDDEEAVESKAEGKGDEAISSEGEADSEEGLGAPKDEDYSIIPVDPALRELEVSLDFEVWKEMLESISIGDVYVPESPCCSSPQEDNMNLSEGSISEGAEEEETAVKENPSSTTEVDTSPSLGNSLDKQTQHQPCRGGSWAVKRAPYKPPLCLPPFSFPLFQQWPLYTNMSVRRGMTEHRWTPRWHPGAMSQGRGFPQRQPFFFRVGQGRGHHPNAPGSQANAGNCVHPGNLWGPRRDTSQPRGHARGKRGGCFSSQRPQSSGGNTSTQSGGDSIKSAPNKSRDVSGQRRWFNNPDSQSSVSISSGDKVEKSTNNQPLNSKGGYTARRHQGSAKKPSVPNKMGGNILGTKGSQNKAQPVPRGGRGSGSTKGPQKK